MCACLVLNRLTWCVDSIPVLQVGAMMMENLVDIDWAGGVVILLP
jgi:hypothetical protein